MNGDTTKIVERIENSVDAILKELVEEAKAVDLIIALRSEIKDVDSLDKIAAMDDKEIAKYLKVIAPDVDVDLTQIQRNLYFYGVGLQNSVFCSSSRYIAAKEFLSGLLEQFNEFANYDSDIDKIQKEKTEENIRIYTELKDSIDDGKFVGRVGDLANYKALFDESWTDTDKLSACTMLVKAHLEQLKLEEELRRELALSEEAKGLEDKAESVSLDIERQLEERINVKMLARLDIPEEETKHIEQCREMLVPYTDILSKFSENLELASFYEGYKERFITGEISHTELLEKLTDKQYEEFLVYCLSDSLKVFYDISTKGYDDEEELALANGMLIGTLNRCSNFSMLLNFYETHKVKIEKDIFVEEPVIEEIIPLEKLEVSDDALSQINDAKNMVKPYLDVLDRKMRSVVLARTFKSFREEIRMGKFDFDEISKRLISNDYELFLAYCLRSALGNVNEILAGSYLDEEKELARDMFAGDLNFCSNVLVLLDKYQTEKKHAAEIANSDDLSSEDSLSEMMSDGESAEIIFYSKNGSDYEIDRSLKNLSLDKQREVASLIEKLSSKHFGKTTSVYKAADNIPKLRTMCGNKVFITYKRLIDDHFLVFHADETSIIGDKAAAQPISSYDLRVEDEIRTVLNDGSRLDGGTIACRKLISDSRKKFEEIKNINQEMGKGVSNE